MHVTIVTDRYAPEARSAAYLSQVLAQGLARLGHDVSVITRMPSHFLPDAQAKAPQPVETSAGMNVKRISGVTSSPAIWLRVLDQLVVSFKIILALWTAPKSDVLIVYSPPLLLSFTAVMQKWLRRWPYVLNLHDLYPQTAIDLGVLRNRTLIWLATLIESTVYKNADKIIVAAPASRRILTQDKRVPAERVEMMFNYIDVAACAPGPIENGFRKRNGIQGSFVVIYAGLMGLAQDLAPVIECARQVQDERDWVFVLAGDGSCAAKWAEASRGLPNVKMVGSLSYPDYHEALQAADVCLVALSAAFKAPAVPGKIPTIMAAGKPIVASVPVGNDTREVLDAACCGIAVQPEHPEELLAALRSLKQQPDLRQEWGANASRYAAAHFDAETAIKRIESILQEVHEATGGHRLPRKTVASSDRG
jgi:colanic acid biosynthesis glycosyl transferase WcaI